MGLSEAKLRVLGQKKSAYAVPWTGLYGIKLGAFMPAFAVNSPNPGIDRWDNYGTDVESLIDVDYGCVFGVQCVSCITLHNMSYEADTNVLFLC